MSQSSFSPLSRSKGDKIISPILKHAPTNYDYFPKMFAFTRFAMMPKRSEWIWKDFGETVSCFSSSYMSVL